MLGRSSQHFIPLCCREREEKRVSSILKVMEGSSDVFPPSAGGKKEEGASSALFLRGRTIRAHEEKKKTLEARPTKKGGEEIMDKHVVTFAHYCHGAIAREKRKKRKERRTVTPSPSALNAVRFLSVHRKGRGDGPILLTGGNEKGRAFLVLNERASLCIGSRKSILVPICGTFPPVYKSSLETSFQFEHGRRKRGSEKTARVCDPPLTQIKPKKIIRRMTA